MLMNFTDVARNAPTGHAGAYADTKIGQPRLGQYRCSALIDNCTSSTGITFGMICLTNTRMPEAPNHTADSTYCERAASTAAGLAIRARFSP